MDACCLVSYPVYFLKGDLLTQPFESKYRPNAVAYLSKPKQRIVVFNRGDNYFEPVTAANKIVKISTNTQPTN